MLRSHEEFYGKAAMMKGKIAEGAICYTGDLFDPARTKNSLNYYAGIASDLKKAECQVLAITDMAGLIRPPAARALIAALRDVTDLPIHLHTHDTSGIAGATLIATAEAGVDAIDVATDAMSGTTSQPCLGSVVEALRYTTATPVSTPRQSGGSASIGRVFASSMRRSRAICAQARRRSISMKCLAVGSRT